MDTAPQNPSRDSGTAALQGSLGSWRHCSTEPCTEWLVTAPQRPLGSWRHCSTEPYAPNGWPLHRRGLWVPRGTVPQSLFARKYCRCSARANNHGKANAYGGPPLTWDLVPETCFTWDLGTPPYLGPGMLHTMSHTIATSCYNLYNIVQHHIIMYVSSSDIMLWSRHACHISNADSLCGHTNQLIMQDNWFNSCVTPLQ